TAARSVAATERPSTVRAAARARASRLAARVRDHRFWLIGRAGPDYVPAGPVVSRGEASMATESSAVVRFINLVQQQQRQPIENTAPAGGDLTTDFVDQLRPARSKAPVLFLAITVFAVAAAAVGIYVGKRYLASSDEHSPATSAARPVAAT